MSLRKEIEEILRAVVITTATDLNDKFAVDVLPRKLLYFRYGIVRNFSGSSGRKGSWICQ